MGSNKKSKAAKKRQQSQVRDTDTGLFAWKNITEGTEEAETSVHDAEAVDDDDELEDGFDYMRDDNGDNSAECTARFCCTERMVGGHSRVVWSWNHLLA